MEDIIKHFTILKGRTSKAYDAEHHKPHEEAPQQKQHYYFNVEKSGQVPHFQIMSVRQSHKFVSPSTTPHVN